MSARIDSSAADAESDAATEANYTAIRTKVSAYSCPSDSPIFAVTSNYVGSRGGPFQIRNMDVGFFRSTATSPNVPVKIRDIVDGASKTAAMSEVQTGTNTTAVPIGDSRAIRCFYTGTNNVTATIDAAKQFMDSCQKISATTATGCSRGTSYSWQQSYQEYNNYFFYNHFCGPNSISCRNAVTYSHIDKAGCALPSSYHSGGVNVVFADGNVQFIGNSIETPVWWSYGSLDGGIDGF